MKIGKIFSFVIIITAFLSGCNYSSDVPKMSERYDQLCVIGTELKEFTYRGDKERQLLYYIGTTRDDTILVIYGKSIKNNFPKAIFNTGDILELVKKSK